MTIGKESGCIDIWECDLLEETLVWNSWMYQILGLSDTSQTIYCKVLGDVYIQKIGLLMTWLLEMPLMALRLTTPIFASFGRTVAFTKYVLQGM